MFKQDSLVLGFIPGLFIPIIISVLFHSYFFGLPTANEFWEKIIMNREVLAPTLSFGCAFNLGIFYLFIQKDKILASRGVILATFIYVGIVVYLKFLA